MIHWEANHCDHREISSWVVGKILPKTFSKSSWNSLILLKTVLTVSYDFVKQLTLLTDGGGDNWDSDCTRASKGMEWRLTIMLMPHHHSELLERLFAALSWFGPARDCKDLILVLLMSLLFIWEIREFMTVRFYSNKIGTPNVPTFGDDHRSCY